MAETQQSEEETQRTAQIEDRLKKHLGLEVKDVTPIGRGHNSIMRLVTFVSTSSPLHSSKALTTPISTDVVTCLFRQRNPDGELDPKIAVPNEVIALHLARSGGLPVPRVYDWSTEEDGWIVMEVLPGTDMKTIFESLDREVPQQNDIWHKMLDSQADMVKRLKSIELPSQLGYGGFQFDSDQTTIVSGEMPLPYGGPHSTLSGLYKEMITRQLKAADGSRILKGWRDNGLRDRLDKFVREGLDDVLGKVKANKTYLIHGDMGMHNMLWDEKKQEISGVFDFEWSHSVSVADEYFYSFPFEFGVYGGPYDDDPISSLLNNSLLHGFPDPLPEAQPKPTGPGGPGTPAWVDWPLASTWDAILGKHQVPRPSTIEGFEDIARVYWMAQELCQWWFSQERVIQRLGEEKVEGSRKEGEVKLGKYLEYWGY